MFPYQQPGDIIKYVTYRNPKIGSIDEVLNILDDFAKKYPMYKLSKFKADILSNEIIRQKPKKVLEIGTFFGYSALNIARILPTGSTLTCIEANDANAEVATKMLSLGLGNSNLARNVKILNGISTNVIPTLSTADSNSLYSKSNRNNEFAYDFIFLDHDKDSYLNDLKLLEKYNLLSDKCIIVADNVLFPGAPGYLEYVGGKENINIRNSNGYMTRLEKAPFERIGFETNWKEVDDAMSISVFYK